MPITDMIRQQELETLVGRFEQRGFAWARRCFFGQAGIIVGTPSAQIPSDGIRLAWKHAVQLYWNGSHWEARLTPHGGPHWIKTAPTLDQLEEVALEALGANPRRPGAGWQKGAGWAND